MKKLAICLLALITFSFVLIGGQTVKAGSSYFSLTSSDVDSSGNLKTYGVNLPYVNYPKIHEDLNVSDTIKDVVYRNLRSGCTETTTSIYKTLPWLGEKEGYISNEQSNNMYTVGNCDSRYTDGGVNLENGGWIAPEAYGNWAYKGARFNTKAFSIDGVDKKFQYATNIRKADYDGFYSTLMNLDGIQEKDDAILWVENTSRPTQDSSNSLFDNNGFNFSPVGGEKLLSSGTSLFRREFSLTAEELAIINDLTLKYKADDFGKVYINGVEVTSITQNISPEKSGYVGNSVTISATDLKSTYSLTEGNNVIAFQINDKARWTTEDTVGSNAVGLWYNAEFTRKDCAITSLSATPNIEVTKSQSGDVTGTNTINLAMNFTNSPSVSFAQSGLPAGVRADAISNCTSASCSKTNKLTISPNAVAGTYDITVTASGCETKTATYKLTIKDPLDPIYSCTPEPTTGVAPLAVKVTTSWTNLLRQKFDYDLGDGVIQSDKPSIFYYSYSSANTYQIKVRPNELKNDGTNYPWTSCSTTVTVSDESSTDGGEVAP